jgi:hypothetical protein
VNRPLLFLIFLVGALAEPTSATDCPAFGVPLKVASWKGSTKYSPPNITFDVMHQSEVPLTVGGVSLRNDPGRQVSELTYTVTNKSGATLRAISFLVTFFNDRNEPLGGEVINGGESCVQGGTPDIAELRTPLAHYVDSGQRVSLAVTSFRTDAQSWKGDHELIVKSMKQLH